VGDIPAGWAEATLGELGTWVSGTTPSKANPALWEGGTIPWASPKDIKRDVIEDTEDRITQAAFDRGGAVVVPAGAVLIVTRSGILKHSVPTAVAGVDLAINQDIKALILAPGIDPSFIAEQIRVFQADVLKVAAKVGATVESLDFPRLVAFPVRIAPAGEQKRIVERLNTVKLQFARSKVKVRDVADFLARARRALVEKELRRPVSPKGSGLRRQPFRLGELLVAPIRNGLSVRGGSEPPGVRALRLSALRSDIIDVDDVRYLPIGADRAAKYTLEPGDVLISRGSGTRSLVGMASLVPTVEEPTIFPDTAFRLKLNQDRVFPEWFVMAWNAPSLRVKLEQAARTTAGIWKISQRDLAGLTFDIPPMNDQIETAERLRNANARLDRVVERRRRAEKLLARAEEVICLRAFKGLLAPRIEAEGSASDLLAAIAASAKPPQPKRARPRMPTKTTLEHIEALLPDWPNGGQTFEQLRKLVSAPYEEIKAAVYELLESGRIAQRFDPDAGLVRLVMLS
jgi:type I restriction enzyme S subunit